MSTPLRRSRRRWAARRAAQVAALVLGAALLWTLAALVSVRDDLERARDVLLEVRDTASVTDAAPRLAEAEADLERASARLRHPGPAVVARLPLLGRSVSGIERTATAGLAVVRGTRTVLDLADDEGLVDEGGVDVERLRALQEALQATADASREPVRRLVAQPTRGVPGLVADPLRQAQEQLADVPDALAEAAAAVRGLSGVLGADEPRQLLVVLENNAELRGTGGIVTVFAEAVTDGGSVDVGPFRDVEGVADRPEAVRRVPAPEDYRRLWGRYLADSTLWKNANMSPDVPTSSAVLSAVVDASIGRRPTAVLWLDVRTIEAVLRATGPAVLPDGSQLAAEDTVRTLLSDAYLDAPDTREGQKQRREQLRGVADAVLDRLLGGGADPAELGLALAEAARGRHLAVWSAEPDEQADLVAGGLAGEVAAGDGDLASFTVQNFGGGGGEGNKLDYYARRQVSASVEVGLDRAVVRQEVALRNTAPRSGLPRYVAGLTSPGVLNSLVTLALPRDAELLEFSREGEPVRTEVLAEGDHRVVTDTTELPPGTTATWVLRYEIPIEDGRYTMTAVPQPLAVDGGLALEVRATRGTELTTDHPDGLQDGAFRSSGPFDRTAVVTVRAVQRSLVGRAVERVKRFWSEPLG